MSIPKVTKPAHWFLDAAEIAAARGSSGVNRTLATFTDGNRVTALIDGESIMSSLRHDIGGAGRGDFIHLCAWRLNIATELDRSSVPTAASRFDSVIRDASGRGAVVRALLWGPIGVEKLYSSDLTNENDQAARFINSLPGATAVLDSRFPDATHGSHHQKCAVIQNGQDIVAYCGSLDIHNDTWDTSSHNNDVKRRKGNAHAARHEIQLQLRGPAALDIYSNFRDRWNEHEVAAGTIAPKHITAAPAAGGKPLGTHCVQVLRTFACIGEAGKSDNHYRDFAPHGETTCLAGYLKAIALATDYIYIEDQYLVLDEIAQALKLALRTIRALILVVPGEPDENAKVQPLFNFYQAQFLSVVGAEHPDKVHVYGLVQPATGDSIFIHSKIMIVDDVYVVAGSANIDRRSMTHDSELAAAVVDLDLVDGVCRFARDLRLKLWGEHLDLAIGDPKIKDPLDGVKVWEQLATSRKGRVRRHTPGAKQSAGPADFGFRKIGWDDDIDPDGRCAKVLKNRSQINEADLAEAAALAFDTDARHWFLDDSEIEATRGNGDLKRTLRVFTEGNLVEPLIDGEALMRELHGDMTRTKSGDFIHLTAWRLNITQDLLPLGRPSAPRASRFDNVIRGARGRNVIVRSMIWKAIAAGFSPSSIPPMIGENTDARDFINSVGGTAVIDGRHPIAGSHHQKSAIVLRDGEAVAYCGGIDVCPDRWDTTLHNSDPRRTPESKVFAGWHDAHVRIRGPAALDIESNFRDRWNDRENPAFVPGQPTLVRITAPLPPVAKSPGTHNVQILRTYACAPPKTLLTPTNHYRDFAPSGETTCLAGYLKAIRQARNYIYLEDQYLVSEELARALSLALNTIRKLIIVVPSSTDGFPEAAFNFHQELFLKIVRAGHDSKVHVYHLVQPKTGTPIYVHSKVMIIDDVYAAVGSPNINRRSMSHDTELAAAVVDSEIVDGVCRFARDLRKQLWGEHLDVPTTASATAIADPILGVAEWERQASAGTFRVRRHVTPLPQKEYSWTWDSSADPDGRCRPSRPIAVVSETEGIDAEGAELIELAECVVAGAVEGRRSEALLREICAQTGLRFAPSPAQIFRAFAGSPTRDRERLNRFLEVVAMPSTVLERDLEKGDFLVRRGDGYSAHFAVIASPELRDIDGLARLGMRPETNRSGFYAHVVEAGARPHRRDDFFARRITDDNGVLPRNTLVVRLR